MMGSGAIEGPAPPGAEGGLPARPLDAGGVDDGAGSVDVDDF